MGTITIKNIMFFMIILKSFINQSISKPLTNVKNLIKTHKNISFNKKKFNLNHTIFKIFADKKFFLSYKILFYKKIIKDNNNIITRITSEELRIRLNILNQKSQMKILKYNSIVHASIESYLRMGKYLGKIISLADLYFPMFEKKLDSYNLPKELKYLAIIESNLNPIISSKAGARGIWQFMPNTGKVYKLKINNIYDDRNNPIKSTEAACKYIKYLYNKIGNWELVLAAYNSGIGTVDKVLQKNKNKKDFWAFLDSFPKETQNYIPKFIAINYIMNYYKEHNIYVYHFFPKKYVEKKISSISTTTR